jgi:hypothetical protein
MNTLLILITRFVAVLWSGWCSLVIGVSLKLVLLPAYAVCSLIECNLVVLPENACYVADTDEARLNLLYMLSGLALAYLLGCLFGKLLERQRDFMRWLCKTHEKEE